MNGARLQKSDHDNLPITLDEIVNNAIECRDAGADALHLHIRNEQGTHSLDHAVYRHNIDVLSEKLGNDFPIQITTEAAAIFSPKEQRLAIETVKPACVSIALAEFFPENHEAVWPESTQSLYFCLKNNIGVQWILYSAQDISRLDQFIRDAKIPDMQWSCLFVCGRYDKGFESKANDFLDYLNLWSLHPDFSHRHWMVCAFGMAETRILTAAMALSGSLMGHVRVGFENNFLHANGTMASSNADRVRTMSLLRKALGFQTPEPTYICQALGCDI